MFKKVETENEQAIFEQIWSDVCEEKGFLPDPCVDHATRYLIDNRLVVNGQTVVPEEGFQYIGTIELVPYNPAVYTTVEGRFEPYDTYHKVKDHGHRTFEIDKLCITKDYRSKGHLPDVLHALMEHGEEANVKYYIATTEYAFYRTLKIGCSVKLEQIGDRIRRPKNSMIPMLCDVDVLFARIDEYEWYQHPRKLSEV